MYCPECYTEYIKEITVCSDCKVALVEALRKEKPIEEIRWVKVRQFPGNLLTDMVGEVLDNMGIPYYIKADGITATYQATSAGLSGVWVDLFVPEEHVKKTKTLLIQLID